MSLRNTGQLGIGTTTPSNILHIASTSATGAILNLETTHSGGIPIYNMKGAHSAQLRYQDENGNNQSRIDFNDSGDFNFIKAADGTSHLKITSSGDVGIGTVTPNSKLQVDGAVQVADDTDAASADKVGALRYRTSGNNSYVDMCMQTGASTYAWVNIVQNNW